MDRQRTVSRRVANIEVRTAADTATSRRRLAAGMLLVLIAGCGADTVSAHGGGLDRHGCHTRRSTGEYHCHGGGAPPASARLAPAPRAPRERMRANEDGAPFANCAEARAAGAAPVRRGEPGYGPHLDRDGDGIGCEPRRRR
jgi:Excalibur calcium-binding domain